MSETNPLGDIFTPAKVEPDYNPMDMPFDPMDGAKPEATQTSASPVPQPVTEHDQMAKFDPETVQTQEQLPQHVQDAINSGISPEQAMKMANITDTQAKGLRVGHFFSQGTTYVFVDSLDRTQADSLAAKHAAYAYRFNLGMSTAGIDNFSPALPFDPNDGSPAPVFTEAEIEAANLENPIIWRSIFRLTPSIYG